MTVPLIARANHAFSLEDLRRWGRQRLAAHKVPSRLPVLQTLPRNAMAR
jgi:acyl-CoA synthetase (AMP-forming)/AMP-acid ligase II